MRILRQKTVAGMNRIHISNLSRRDDLVNFQVTINATSRPHTISFVGKLDMHGIPVGFAVNGYGLDSNLSASANDAKGNFATIGNQDLFEHGKCWEEFARD